MGWTISTAVSSQALKGLLARAFDEDLGQTGDVTCNLLFDGTERATGYFLAKEAGILAGGPFIQEVYGCVNDCTCVTRLLPDGTPLTPGRIFCSVEGPLAGLLTAERTVLNLLQRLSGIATQTRRYCEKIRNFPACRVTDTRKTTPGLRALEKYAIRVGGGWNHRFGLFDAVMIKDNHIQAIGSVADAVTRVRSKVGHTVKVEVEVESLEAALEARDAGADIVMLDNMSPDDMKECVRALDGAVIVEASGGITLETIGDVVKSGVDCISCGALTHSVRALDISFELGEEDPSKP